MSPKTIIVIIIIIILVGIGAWYGMGVGQNEIQPYSYETGNASNTAGAVNSVTTKSSVESDLQTIDNQMSALSSDSASVDQGMNDQQIPQE